VTDAPRDHLTTERANPASAGLERMGAAEVVDLMLAEDERALAAMRAARGELAAAAELVATRLEAGGRLLYLGAGTSGRLGVLDAAECPPTFGSDPALVQGVLAGGAPALLVAVEGAEDDGAAAARDLDAREVGEHDVVVGITAGGTTPYVREGLTHARARGAATVLIACVPHEQVPDDADVSVRIVTGPEVVAGSTRLKAGTVTKLALNLLSTHAMVRLGKVHGNLMVDVDTSANAKLVQRGTSLVAELTGLARPEARALLEAAGGRVKTAAVMHAADCSRAEAEQRLERAGGRLREALGAD
jgi:N-acetylmuramic acid 6-phosphate etherase